MLNKEGQLNSFDEWHEQLADAQAGILHEFASKRSNFCRCTEDVLQHLRRVSQTRLCRLAAPVGHYIIAETLYKNSNTGLLLN